ncbi:MAG: hypothetical protein MJA83_13400, partial [Gammaproteobacteria bacterium]|nr:hypothetical protein [Gammaproteobacteria bacterium]
RFDPTALGLHCRFGVWAQRGVDDVALAVAGPSAVLEGFLTAFRAALGPRGGDPVYRTRIVKSTTQILT